MSHELEVAIKAARLAGETLEYYFETLIEKEEKEDKSIVTKADLEADKIILKEIKENFPDHNILSEETGLVDNGSDYVWVIDPLDGTTNFSRGLPVFATSLALFKSEEPVLSVVYNPITNSFYQAEVGKGAFLNGEKIQVSDVETLPKSIVTLGRARGDADKETTLDIFNKLYLKLSSQRILGSSALELSWVASGRLEGFISIGLKKWDVAGGLLLVSEAGGKITNFAGDSITDTDTNFVASNGKIHEELLEALKSNKI